MDASVNVADDCCCKAARTLPEVLKINKRWHDDYATLYDKYNELKVRYHRDVESQRRNEDRIYLPTSLSDSQKKEASKPDDDEHIEVLKQQLVVYKEDFIQEQQENKDLQSSNQALKVNLRELSNELSVVTQKRDTYRRQYEQVNREKLHIVEELRRLSVDGPSTTYLHR